MIEGLGYVWLEVADLAQSVAFYRDALRFGLERTDTGKPPTAHLRAGDLSVVLAEVPGAAASRRGRGVLLTVEVSGVDAYHDALVARGLDPSRPVDADHRRRFTVRDPDGYAWTFVQSLA